MVHGDFFRILDGDSFLSSAQVLTSSLWSMGYQKFFSWMKETSFNISVREQQFGLEVTLVSASTLRKIQAAIGVENVNFGDGPYHPDLLGVYVAHHPWSHRPAILVSPEKVMEACLQLGRSADQAVSNGKAAQERHTSNSSPMMRLYPALLAHVTFHELAHAGMCEAAAVPCPGHRTWQAIAEAFDAGHQQTAETMLETTLSFEKNSCHWRPRQRLTVQTAYARHTIEESLATAIALRQRYDAPIASLLRDWVSRQPPPYRAGLHWEIDDEALFTTARSWTHAKPLLHAMDVEQSADPRAQRRLRDFQSFAADLHSSGRAVRHTVDFRAFCG